MDEFKILAIGDVVAKAGVLALEKALGKIISDTNADFVIVNAENASNGSGLDKKTYERLKRLNIDAITMGNHTWGKKEIFEIIGSPMIIRPANLPKSVPGKGFRIYEKGGKKIAVVNMLGRVAINVLSDNPFICMENILKELRKHEVDYIVVDMHAETTAEKIAFARYFDGDVSVVFGTHTHVQTADNSILENNTGYITDLGMTGITSGVIGMEKEVAFKRFVKTLPERYMPETKGKCEIMGALFVLNKRGVKEVKRIRYDVRKEKYID